MTENARGGMYLDVAANNFANQNGAGTTNSPNGNPGAPSQANPMSTTNLPNSNPGGSSGNSNPGSGEGQ